MAIGFATVKTFFKEVESFLKANDKLGLLKLDDKDLQQNQGMSNSTPEIKK